MHPGVNPFYFSGQKPDACISTDAVQKEKHVRELAPLQVRILFIFLIANRLADRLANKGERRAWP
jgi:hypothetical protein